MIKYDNVTQTKLDVSSSERWNHLVKGNNKLQRFQNNRRVGRNHDTDDRLNYFNRWQFPVDTPY